MTFEQWASNAELSEVTEAHIALYKAAYMAGAEAAYPTLSSICLERNGLQVENLKLTAALGKIKELFEV